MDSFFSRNRNALVLISVLLAQVIGLAVQVRRPAPNPGDKGSVRLIRSWVVGLVGPPERGLHATGSGVRGFWSNYIDLIHVRRENKDLQDQLDRLRLEEASVAEDAKQAERLQTVLGFREKYVYKTTPAQVIGTSGTEHSQVLLIDKGTRDGIRPDMPVITPDGIVGKTRDVFARTSQVLEISDAASGAGVILEKTRIRGVLRGNNWGQPEIVNVSPDDRIQAGEAVVTSGGDAIFPRGLPVGTVEKVVSDPDGTLVDVLIKPAANLARLEEVLVVTSSGDQMPAQMQQDLSEAQQRASDVLAERLPSRIDPNAPPDEQQEQGAAAADAEGRPMRPPQAARADEFSPNDTPPADTLVPGKRSAPELSGHGQEDAPARAAAPSPDPASPAPAHGNAASTAVPGAAAPGIASRGHADLPNGEAATPRRTIGAATPAAVKPASATEGAVSAHDVHPPRPAEHASQGEPSPPPASTPEPQGRD